MENQRVENNGRAKSPACVHTIIAVSGPGRDLAEPLLSTVGMRLLLNEHFTRYSGIALVYTLCMYVCVCVCVSCALCVLYMK